MLKPLLISALHEEDLAFENSHEISILILREKYSSLWLWYKLKFDKLSCPFLASPQKFTVYLVVLLVYT